MRWTKEDHIIAAVDGSDTSIAALAYAGDLAAALGVSIEVVTTWSYPPYSTPATVTQWDPERDATTIQEDSIRVAFGETPPVPLTTRISGGPAARTLIELSSSAAMLVMGSRGRGGFTGLLLGSVSTACAAHAHCPVTIVHPRPAEDVDES